MKVLMDAYWWFSGPPSGRNVVRSLAFGWAETYPQDGITLMLPRSDRDRRELDQISSDHPNLTFSFTHAPQHAVAAMTAGLLSNSFDVVLTHNFAPLGVGGLRCVFIHDLMFTEHPEWFTRAERAYLKGICWSALRAQRIFTSSSSESERIRKRLPNTKASTMNVGLALSKEYADAKPAPLELGSTPDGFLLSVGRVNVRKNLERLVRSLLKDSLISTKRPLVIVGAPDGAQGSTEALEAATAEGSVIWTGAISSGELKWAYENCRAFLFPSLDEGFGLPVLEAVHANARIALSDIPAFREFGDVGVFFDPEDDDDIASSVAMLLNEVPKKAADAESMISWESVVTRLRNEVVRK